MTILFVALVILSVLAIVSAIRWTRADSDGLLRVPGHPVTRRGRGPTHRPRLL